MLISLGRAIKFSLQQFRRNLWLSIATITLLVLPLLSINIIISLGAMAKAITDGIQDKIDVSVYFKPGITDEQAQAVRDAILKLPAVENVDFVSREGALARFKERHASDPVILESLNELGDNPFGATLAVKAQEISDYPIIMKALEDPVYAELIEEKNFDDHRITISKIERVMKNVRSFGAGVALVFGVIAILIVINSIRVSIYTHRDEIGIMRMVGAGSWFVRGPFLIEAVLFSLIAMVITLLIVYPSLNFIQPYLNNLFDGINVDLLQYFNRHFVTVFGGEFLGVVFLTVLSTGLAIRRYLKV